MILLQAMMALPFGLLLLFAAGFAVVYVGLWLLRIAFGLIDGYRGRRERPPLLSAGQIVALGVIAALLLCAWFIYVLETTEPLIN